MPQIVKDQAMITATIALFGLAVYFSALFLFGLLWRRREDIQKLKKEKMPGEQQFPSQANRAGEYAHLG
jgi:hypothetical protein